MLNIQISDTQIFSPGLKDDKKFKKDYRKSGSDYMNTLSSEVGPSGEHTMYTRPRPNPEPDPTGEHTMSMYTLGGGTAKTIYICTLHSANFHE